MKKRLLLFGCFLILLKVGNSQTQGDLAINNIRGSVNAYGELFNQNGNKPAFEVPKGSGLHTIFMNTIWIGGLTQNDDLHMAAQTYHDRQGGRGSDFSAGPIANQYPASYDNRYNRIWKINRGTVKKHRQNYFKPNYTTPQIIKNWPASKDTSLGIDHHPAPYVDSNDNDKYDPSNGDYPKIRGDKAIFFIVNDSRSPQEETNSKKMGIEIQGMVYAYDSPANPALKHTIFVNYRMKNHSNNAYQGVYLGNFTDFDNGAPFDDYIGCDTQNNLYYGYNGNNYDTQNYKNLPPASGGVFLSNPLNSFVYYQNDFSNQGNPEKPEDYYNYLQGIWKNGAPMTKGGDGIGGTDITRYLFPGNPRKPNQWSEESVGNFPFDRRGVGVAGPFEFQPGESHCLDMAFIYAQDSTRNDTNSRLKSVTKLKNRTKVIKQFYEKQNFDCEPIVPEVSKRGKSSVRNNNTLKLFPNPASQTIKVKFSKPNQSAKALKIYSIDGRKVIHKENLSGSKATVSVSNLEPGIYPVFIKTKDRVYRKKLIKK